MMQHEWWVPLPTRKTWETNIKELTTQIPILPVYEALKKAVDSRVPASPFAILFSGGVDSLLLAVLCKHANPVLLTVAVQDESIAPSSDLVVAKQAAIHLGLRHEIVLLNAKDTLHHLKTTVQLLATEDKVLVHGVNAGVGAVEHAAYSYLAHKGITTVLTGLGSEELFAGYERHQKAANVQEECLQGLLAMHERDLRREALLARYFGMRVFTPFLDKNLIITALHLPVHEIIDSTENKKPVREALRTLGFREYAQRRKKAAQYGSRVHEVLRKASSKEGLKITEYLATLWT